MTWAQQGWVGEQSQSWMEQENKVVRVLREGVEGGCYFPNALQNCLKF